MVVEDDTFTRSMIVSTLQLQGIDVVIECALASQAIRSCNLLKPSIALLDLDLGAGPSGIDLALALRRSHSTIGIVMLTTFEDPRLHSPGLPNLPSGSVYLVKKEISNIDVLFTAIKKTIIESGSLPKEIANKLIKPAFSKLSDSQIEILRLVAKGLSNSEIAKNRGINEKSVEQTISRISKLLEIQSMPESNQRVQISRYYFKLTGVRNADDKS